MTMIFREADGKFSFWRYMVVHPEGLPLTYTLEISRTRAIKKHMANREGDWSDQFAVGFRTKKVRLQVQAR